MACAQPNLTPGWVSTQSAAGWRLIPTYVGLQAPRNGCGCAAIKPGHASVQGAAAASDAVHRAGALGFGPGNPIYFDMEGYVPGRPTSAAVLASLAAWTPALHAAGYKSGVYSSGGSGIRDLTSQYGTSFTEPDDIWIADWNRQRSTASSYVPGGEWNSHRRLHQYAGGHNETHGGVKFEIDSNFLDGAIAGASGAAGTGPPIPDGTLVQLDGSQAIYEIARGAPVFMSVQYWSTLGAPPPNSITPQEFASLNQVPSDGTFLETATGALYRVAGGAPLPISNRSLFANVQPVRIDPWDIADIASPETHLNVQPLDGTVIEGLPSGSY